MNNKSLVKFEGGSKGEFWGTLVKGFSKSIQAFPKILKYPLCLEKVFLFFTDVIL